MSCEIDSLCTTGNCRRVDLVALRTGVPALEGRQGGWGRPCAWVVPRGVRSERLGMAQNGGFQSSHVRKKNDGRTDNLQDNELPWS